MWFVKLNLMSHEVKQQNKSIIKKNRIIEQRKIRSFKFDYGQKGVIFNVWPI